jgi:hypothetical protein
MTSAALVRFPSDLRDGLCSAFIAERERWVLWLPVAFGVGISVYFALPQELVWFAGATTSVVSVIGLVVLSRGISLRLVMVLLLFAARGFSAAQWRAHIAIRSDAGVTYLSNPQASPFVRDIWQRRLGVEGFMPFGADGLNCDAVGRSEQLAGHVVAVVEDARGFEEECRRADILISTEPIPRSCRGPAVTIGRFDVWRSGAHAVWLSDENQPTTVWRARGRDPGRP